MNALATIANTLWWMSNLPAWHAFRRTLHRPEQTQAKVLRTIVNRSRDTAFGKTHGFDQIRTVDDFRQRVPLRQYTEFEPWIDRIRAGEQRVLTSDPVVRLATTAGTSAARKLIPYTRSLQAEFNRAIGPWIVDLFHTHPALMTGRAYWSVSPVARHDTEASAVPIGFEEDSEYLGGLQRRLVDSVMAVPASVRHAPTVEVWRALTIQHLSEVRDLRLISIWHPSFLELLLRDRPTSAQALWPDLKLISCWADGHAALAIGDLQRAFPGVVIQPKGLIATEAIVSIPFAGAWPIALRSHYFEFLDDAGNVRGAHELSADESYELVITTSGGLYRYRMNDRVRVESMIARTPSIRFVGKAGVVSDRFGEKLSEAFVASAIDTARGDRTWSFAMLAPAGNRYVLYVQGDAPTDLALRIDDALHANPQYAYCRDLQQLAGPRVFRINRDADAAFTARLVSIGQRLGDIKPAALSVLEDWDRHFIGDFERDPRPAALGDAAA